MPFLIGIEDNLMDQAEDNINDGTYIIDLDKDKITSKQKTSVILSNTGKYKSSQKDDLPELPEKYSKKLAKNLKDIVERSRRRKQPLTNEEVEKIRMEFFNFFVNIFREYDKFITTTKNNGEQIKIADGVQACFDYEKYKSVTENDQKPFFKQFLGMQMFTRFLERKLWASKNEDVIDVFLFDEHIRMKILRKQKRLFQSVRFSSIL